jgi:hypothetical protein
VRAEEWLGGILAVLGLADIRNIAEFDKITKLKERLCLCSDILLVTILLKFDFRNS